MARYAGVPDVVLVPDDRDSCDAAMLAGRSLTEAAPSSPARLAMAGLAEVLLATRPGHVANGARRSGWRSRVRSRR